jgi:hypothetical protein
MTKAGDRTAEISCFISSTVAILNDIDAAIQSQTNGIVADRMWVTPEEKTARFAGVRQSLSLE